MTMKYIQKPFALNGDKATVPVNSTGTEVSYDQGYTSAYSLAKGESGRRTVERHGQNQILNDLSSAIQLLQQQGLPDWIADKGDGTPYAYTSGAIVNHNGVVYFSTTGNNTSVPGTNLNWTPFNPYGATYGEIRYFSTPDSPAGFINTDGGIITGGVNDPAYQPIILSGSSDVEIIGSDLHFINREDFDRPIGSSGRNIGEQMQDQIVNIVGRLDVDYADLVSGTGAIQVSSQLYGTGTQGSTVNARRFFNFDASLSPGVNVGDQVQPRANSVTRAIYVGVY